MNSYLVRVQLAVYKCQDRVGTATDLPDIATRADTVRAALVQASATPSPSATRSVLPSAPRAALAALRMLCRTGLSAIGSITAADETGFAFNRTVSSLVRAGGTADSYRQADAKLRDLKPCNAAQATYLQGNIEFNGWLAAEAACKEAFYYDAKTLGDVFGPWLACIGPVNTAIVASSKKTGNLEVLKATCTPGYQPPPLGPSQGLLAAQVTAVANQIRQAFDAVHDLKEAAELLEHGLKVLTAREITPGDLAALVTKIQLKLGDLLIDATAEGVRERLRAINFPAITKPLPAAPAKMTITVTETGPGLDLATGTHSVTFKN